MTTKNRKTGLLQRDGDGFPMPVFAASSLVSVSAATAATQGLAVAGYLAFSPTKDCTYFLNSDVAHKASLASHSVRFIHATTATIGFSVAQIIELMS